MSKTINKSDHKNQSKKLWLLIIIVGLLALLLISRILLSPAIIYGANFWLKKQGIDSSIEAIELNIIDGHITITNVTAEKEQKKLFNMGILELYWQWPSLSNKNLAISKIKLDKFKTNIEHYSDALIIGELTFPISKDSKIDKDNSTEENWTVSLNEVEVSNSNICYSQQVTPVAQKADNNKQNDYCLEIGELSWQGSLQYTGTKQSVNSENQIQARGDFSLKDFSLIDNKKNKQLISAQSSTFPDININGINDIKIPHLVIKNLAVMQRDDTSKHKNTVHFEALSIDNLKLTKLDNLSIKNIALNKPELYLVKNNVDSWEHQKWLPASTEKSKPSSEKDTAFKVTIHDLTINNSDFCYVEKHTAVNYCLSFENMKWLGSTQLNTASKSRPFTLTAEGALSLTQVNINNKKSNRNLLTTSALNISNISVQNARDISLSDLSVENLNALQRSEQTNDTTASFNKLLINSFNYSNNNIAIDQINIDGLATAISKDNEGRWEHEKWLPQNNDKQNTATNGTRKKKSKNKSPGFSLNHLAISSRNKMTYTDESTKPPTNIGLQSLDFTTDKLDSSNTTVSSPFKLFAKTIEHSTIELKGKIKPFADKLSFDANGEIKGYDLRSVSALTKKAVGHTIKSGQMDADIKLKAVNGKLDSSISLSLFQFEIKPVAKADADKLDKLFGMPLNQTLTLLRDRNDNIHLKIPVTGNINKPNFDPMDAIIKATSKAATVTLITFYTPYGLVYAGSNALFNIATALDFEPVFFDAGTSELILPVLNEDGEDQLLNLIQLMEDKPKVHLTLCGKTNQSDFIALFPKATNKSDALSKTQLDGLYQLAGKRQVNVKNYLIKQGGLAHDRLILCEPEHDTDEDAIAGVEINI